MKVFSLSLVVLCCLTFSSLWAMDGTIPISKGKAAKKPAALIIEPTLSEAELSVLKKPEYSLENVERDGKGAKVSFPSLQENNSNPAVVRGVSASRQAPVAERNVKNAEVKRGVVQIHQDAVIVWNGKSDGNGRQLTIQQSEMLGRTNKADTALGIIPLPSKPSSLERVGWEYESLKNAAVQKMKLKSSAVADRPAMKPVRAFYCAFGLEIPKLNDWEKTVNASLNSLLLNADVRLDQNALQCLKSYYERGFKNFVFDVYDVRPELYGVWKSPMKFEFQTDKAFFPVQSATIGVPRRFTFGLLVLAPSLLDFDDKCSWKKVADDGDEFERELVQIGRSHFEFTKEELEQCCPSAAEFCRQNGIEKLVGRYYVGVVPKTMAGADDILMVPTNDVAEAAEQKDGVADSKDQSKPKPEDGEQAEQKPEDSEQVEQKPEDSEQVEQKPEGAEKTDQKADEGKQDGGKLDGDTEADPLDNLPKGRII